MAFGFLFYLLNIVCLVIYRLVFSGNKGKKAFLFMVSLHLFIILAIRSIQVGVDVRVQYPSVFQASSNFTFSEIMSKFSFLTQMRPSWTAESGYVLLNWIIGSLLDLPFRSLLIFLAFINAFSVYKFLQRNSHSPLLGAVAVYVLMMDTYLHLLRRATAASIFMLAFCQVEDRHYKRGMLLGLLAFTMHRSSLILWIFFLLSRVQITRKIVLQIIAFTFALAVIARPMAQILIPQVLSFFGKASYMEGGGSWNMAHGYNTTIKYVYVFVCLLIAIGIYFFVDFKLFTTPENNMLFWIFLFFIILSPLDMVIPMISHGASMYFRPSIFLLFANIISQRRENPYIKIFLWVMLFSVLVYIQSRYVMFMLYPNLGPASDAWKMEYKTMFQTFSGQ